LVRYITIYITFLVQIILLCSCSSEKNNAISISYHNTTAKYNAYFIARERIREIENSILQSQDNNYDQILNVLPPLDSSIAHTYGPQIEDCLRKASLVIQNHVNSKWVDDSYNLVGLARLYGYEYTHAIETFKYVFTNGDNDDARHAALINLKRTYIAYNEMNNALAAADFLNKEKLNKKNQKDLHLISAWYYQRNEDYNNMIINLTAVTPLLKRKDNKARIYFTIGQVYQATGFEAEAFNNYKRCLASNPEYELSFYARLYMARVANLEKTRDIKNIRKDFLKLVKDAKNKEFTDKIYYEWGGFELRQNNLQEAIKKFNLSIISSISNPRQKGRSYLRLGEIYYDSLKDYQIAKDYYDSTIQVLPKDYEGYEDVKSRQMVLDDFVEQLNTIALQDSLLKLSEMDSVSLMALIDQEIDKKEALKEAELNRRISQSTGPINSLSPFETTGLTEGGSNWYFNNPSAVSMGRSEYLRIWGNRPLEDNWRRSVKDSGVFAGEQTADNMEDSSDKIVTNEADNKPAEPRTTTGERSTLFASVPQTEEEKNSALKLIEDAYFRLGYIYYFDLREEDNAITTFETLLRRFPDTEHRPDALYQLYLLYNDIEPVKANQFKNSLIKSYPETTFAKLLVNPNYQKESQAVNEILKKEYERAYKFFINEDYLSADRVLDNAISKYPEGNFIPNLKLLKILIVGTTEDLFKYQLRLGEFIEQNPDSDITPYAKTLLNASEKYKESLIKLKDAEFVVIPDQEHYFISVFNSEISGSEVILKKIELFNREYFDNNNLKTGTLKLDNTLTIILVDHFADMEKALYYYDLFKGEEEIQGESQSLKFNNFVISKDNFEVLYKTKELDSYKKFYSLHY